MKNISNALSVTLYLFGILYNQGALKEKMAGFLCTSP